MKKYTNSISMILVSLAMFAMIFTSCKSSKEAVAASEEVHEEIPEAVEVEEKEDYSNFDATEEEPTELDFSQVGPDEITIFSTEWAETSYDDPVKCGYFYTTDNLGEFKMIQGDFRKLGGYKKSTVGFVFGFPKTKTGYLTSYLRFEINTDGEYGIYSWDGKKYHDLVVENTPDVVYLYPSYEINKGYNKLNTLKIEKKNNNTYTLYINGTVVAENIPTLPNGTNGVMAFFSVGKADQEQFPEKPVAVTYRISDSK